ncbi:hypothetical protein SNE40_005442 [Patella caerulea]|uniref:Ras-associating and dilute domain-containing protein n=1 Tax=Patella caerulea TaxID=87958 RepID=A0AAN8K2P0_PATCE
MIKNHSTTALRQTAIMQRQEQTAPSVAPQPPAENAKLKKTKSLSRAQSIKDLRGTLPASCELSIDDRAPGVIKIFGDSVVHGAQYKSVLASTRSTAIELIKQALERYGLSTFNYHEYVLCDTVGKLEPVPSDPDRPAWVVVCQRALKDNDKPLELQEFWKPTDGFYRRYELHNKSDIHTDVNTDDTSGINDNARKIMMSKVHVGAIPMSSSWSGSNSSHEARQDPEGKSLQAPMFDTSSYKEKMLTLQSLSMYPYLLTIRGFHVHHDLVLYPLRAKSLSVGRDNSNSPTADIVCFAPDILGIHCRLNPRSYIDKGINHQLKYMFYIELEVSPGAHVAINGRRVVGKTELHSGDLVALGKHYLFLYKDPTNGYDIPTKLSWLSSRPETTGKRSSLPPAHRSARGVKFATSEELNTSSDNQTSFDVSDEAVTWNGPPKNRPLTLTYAKDREEEILTAIAGLKCLSRRDNPLTVAMLFVLCHEWAVRKFTRHHTRNMYRRLLACIQNSVSSVARNLSQQKFDCIKFSVNTTLQNSDSDHLRHLMYWMSNAISLYCHMVSLDHDTGGSSPEPEDESSSGLKTFLVGLEEIVSFCFQQTVYCITKVLYPLTGKFLESNPFSEHTPQNADGVGKMIFTLHVAYDLAKSVHLHDDVRSQMMTYLLFFIGTSLFNRMMKKDSGPEFYNWNFGVRLQANLSRLEDWIGGKNLEADFHQVCEKLLSLSNLLATSRQALIKMNWQTIREEFNPLNEVQLLKILQGYQIGQGRQPPDHWFPQTEIDQTKELNISLASYPVFLLPTTGPDVTSMNFPDDFYETMDRLQAAFGLEEDDSDSGFSVSNTPRICEQINNNNNNTSNKIFYNKDSPHVLDKHSSRFLLDNDQCSSSPSSPRVGHVFSPSRDELSSASDYFECDTDTADDNTVQWRENLDEQLEMENDLSFRNNDGVIPEEDDSVTYAELESPSNETLTNNALENDGLYVDVVSNGGKTEPGKSLRVLSLEDYSGGSRDLEPTNGFTMASHDQQIHMTSGESGDIFSVTMEKGNSCLGLGLIDGLYTPLQSRGIYIRNILSNSPAEKCGLLRVGDRIMAVNGTSVVDASYQIAMDYIRSTGQDIKLVVARSERDVIAKILASMC